MPVESIIALIAVAMLANVALIMASPGRIGDRVRRTRRRGRALDPRDAPGDPDRPAFADDDAPAAEAGLRPAALERVMRVGTWVFLFAATTIVAVTGLWADRQAAILLVLAGAAAASLALQAVAPGRLPEAAQRMLEGGTGLAVGALLITLTGGALSPFAFTLPLLVVGAALVASPGVTLVLTAGAGLVYVAAIVAATNLGGLASASPLALTEAGVNLVALCLVAYVGMAIGREHRRAREDANRRATIDLLTGLRTRSFMFAALERELERSQRTGRSFCLLMLDLDNLKTINDRHGHLQGDRALRLVGDVIRSGTRRIDTGARFGGDEFVVLLPETDATGGWVLAEKIRQEVGAAGLAAPDGTPVETSVSVGVVTCPQDGEELGELLERADAAMYGSKRSGRDRVTGVAVMDVGIGPVLGPVPDAPEGTPAGAAAAGRGAAGAPTDDEPQTPVGRPGRPV